ncbi:protein sel-1 homolog 3-like [Haliotis rufescens]|uniref:protein sel-1 homolog 3-like n=1 Tax=Haliotis rufescens TaxID=6454 RepID=UPI00201ED678|nr:protein sel-1 homolog 3-like [Haliotis rufescens]
MASLTRYVLLAYVITATFVQTHSGEPQSLSLVLGKKSGDAEEFIQIVHPPESIDNSRLLTVEYTCNSDSTVAVELSIMKDKYQPTLIYRKYWKCDASHFNRRRKVKLRLDDDLGFRPGYFNRQFYFGLKPQLRAFILRDVVKSVVKFKTMHYAHAEAKVLYNVFVTLPYSRPRKLPYKACVPWYWETLQRIPALNNFVCPFEHEVVPLVSYPAVFSGLHYGIYRRFPKYQDPGLEKTRRKTIANPAFTLSMWMYILDYCPEKKGHPNLACGVFIHVSWNNLYMTPILLVDHEGHPRVEVILKRRREHHSIKVNWTFPKHQWIRVTFAVSQSSWNLAVNYGDNYNQTLASEFTYNTEMLMDDTEGDFIVGGNDALVPSFVGYVGKATFYRRRVLEPSKIPMPSPYHPMFALGLTRREVKCQTFMAWISQQERFYQHLLAERILQNKCTDKIYELFIKNENRQCPTMSASKPRKSHILNTFIRRSVNQGRQLGEQGFHGVADAIFNKATTIIEVDIKHIPAALPLLRQAACLGNYDAMYMLSIILNNGLMTKADEIQAQAYLMLGAVDKHRLSTLALGHKHRNGIDGATYDKEQAYMYYKFVAGKTRDDRDLHKESDVLTESVRLTDEMALKEQTDEDGDIFMWLKHQAQAGVASAQIRFGRALFWGSQGLRRNLNAAMEVFRMGAEQGNPDMMFDYGINIYNNKTQEKNKTKAIEYMQKAAGKGNAMAINALGWIAMKKKNYTEAVRYFNRAVQYGNADAAYYLGHMYLEGYHPTDKQDWDKAYKYFEYAAMRGHYDAGVLFAYISMKGTARMSRNLYLAAEWARYVAEKNPAVGIMLRKGLHAYRSGNIPLAFFYYLLAADSGIEVGDFNVAWLCEENKEGLVNHMEKECMWRHYNLSLQREPQLVDSYAMIKMGDYYWYGCRAERDIPKASAFYANSALKGDPHALFNLAFMVEEGAHIPNTTWDILRVPLAHRDSNITLLVYLYTRCKESRKTEAYLPCSLALAKIQMIDVWTRYHIWMKLSSIVGVTMVVVVTLMTLYHQMHTRPRADLVI